jgi:hypothetical protein
MTHQATKAQLEHRCKIHSSAIKASDELSTLRTGCLDAGQWQHRENKGKPRGGKREGSGRKPKHGTPMRSRAIRWTDEQWAQVLAIGTDRLRELVATEYANLDNEQWFDRFDSSQSDEA